MTSSLADTKKIIENLGQGKSYREAMKDTDIRSTSTVAEIQERNSNKIERMREEYKKKLTTYGADLDKSAKTYADFFDEKDWRAREAAAKHINKIYGIEEEGREGGDQYNQINFFNVDPDKAQELRKKFRRVIDTRRSNETG